MVRQSKPVRFIDACIQEHEVVQSFANRVEAQFIVPKAEDLKLSVKGITKQIANEKYPARKKMLKQIRTEIQTIIDSL